MSISTQSENILEFKSLCRSFEDGFVAVDDFNLTIKRGEFVTFLGPSGCGKTTTLRMLAGFDLPSSGEILLNGKDITRLPAHERPINTVFQRYALFPHLNIFDNIAFGLKLKKLPRAEVVKKVEKALEMVDLEVPDTEEFLQVQYRLHVLGTLYPDPAKSLRENTAALAEADYALKRAAYERIYGKPLTYDFEPSDIAGWRRAHEA